jgi:hypothetical protein
MSSSESRLGRVGRSLAERWCAGSDMRRACGLAVFCTAIFVFVNWRGHHQDMVPLAFAPVSIVRHGKPDLDHFRPYFDQLPADQRGAWTEANGHLYARKSVFVPIVAAPLYLPPVLAGVPTEDYRFWIFWGRIVAAILTGMTVVIVYLTLRRWLEVLPATVFSLLFALGTCVWTINGQTLGDHEAILAVAAMAWLLNDFPLSPGRVFWAAMCAGAAVVLRPVTLALLFPVGLYLLTPGRLADWRSYVAAMVGILLFPLELALINEHLFENWYATGFPRSEAVDNWSNFWPEGAAGLLIAPDSGLLVQSPFFFLAFVGGWVVWRDAAPFRHAGLLRAYALGIILHWALFALFLDWQDGLTFTTRTLSEGYPLWMPLVAVGWLSWRHHPWAVPTVAAAGIWAVLYQAVNLSTFNR